MKKIYLALILLLIPTPNAQAAFILSSAIVDFNKNSKQQDIELISQGQESDYIITQVYEVQNPGLANEKHVEIKNPEDAGILVTPDKTILPPGGRKNMRFVLLRDADDSEHIYRVIIKPVINDVSSNSKMALKVLIGYEALVIVRPLNPAPNLTGNRTGNKITFKNSGNTNVILQSGEQCVDPVEKKDCKPLPLTRIYPGQETSMELPFSTTATYFIWDGEKLEKKEF